MKLLIANKKNAAVFVSIFNHLTKFSDSLNIVFNTDNMYIQGMDSSHVSMFEIRIFSDWFESYKCEKSMTIGVPTGILYKVLNAGDENQLLFLEYEEDSDKLGINFKNLKADQKYFPKEFEIPLIDLETDMLHVPECDYDMVAKLPIKSLSTIVDQLCIFGDNMTVEINDSPKMNFSSDGHEGNMCVNMVDDGKEFTDEFSVTCDVDIKLQYSLKYLQMFTSFSKVNKDVTIKMSEGTPFEMYYHMENSENSFVRFFLAPKVDD